MGGESDWEKWIRQQLAGPTRAAIRAHRLGRLGRALVNALALLSAATILLCAGATLTDTLGGTATPHPAPVRGHR